MLISPKNHQITTILKFSFKGVNNEAKYEALISSLQLAHAFMIEAISIYNNSKLMVSQIFSNFRLATKRMQKYLMEVKKNLEKLLQYEVVYISHGEQPPHRYLG